ncbi:MAG: hypothetical protein HY782_15430 [Chloroflexi bacterium]|nr:hypothetical protein [Chloroflexota bacterium]
MATIALGDLLDDLRVADQGLRKFEQRYWLSSQVFYDLYSQGVLDNGQHLEDFSEWAGHYKLKQDRERLFREFSERRAAELRAQSTDGYIDLSPPEPVLEVTD